MVRDAMLDGPNSRESLTGDDVVLLRGFFELLAEWEEQNSRGH